MERWLSSSDGATDLQLQKTQFCANTLSVFILAHSFPEPAEAQGGTAPSSTRAESAGSPEICSQSGMVFRACVDILQGYTEMLVLRLPVLQQFGQQGISVLRVINWFLIVCSTVAEHTCSVISTLDSHQFNFFIFCSYMHNFLICLVYHFAWCYFLSKDSQGLRVITLMISFSLPSCSLSTGRLVFIQNFPYLKVFLFPQNSQDLRTDPDKSTDSLSHLITSMNCFLKSLQ